MSPQGAVGRKLRREGWTDVSRLTSAITGANPSLLLHRLWLGNEHQDTQRHMEVVRDAANSIPDALLGALLGALHGRRAAAAAVLPTTSHQVTITPMWRLVLGHGEDSVLESGLTLSSTYGVPVIPGSALKGACAAQARRTQWPSADMMRVFGGPRPADPTDPARRGSIHFWDALPQQPPRLVVDVLTPHVKPYYDEANAGESTPITHPPAEYHNPVPVRFLAVEQTPFRTFLTGPPTDVAAVIELLRVACDEWGLGGKTAAGYGYCEVTIEQESNR